MKFLFFLLLPIFFVQTAESQTRTENSPSKPAVLIELFTSEGCGSCPPADKILGFLEREQPAPQAEIITLAFHVDFWDHLGLKDIFSSPFFSNRQEEYGKRFKIAELYAPQMVVDGQTEFGGSETGKAVNLVMQAAKTNKAKIELALTGNLLKINISEIAKAENATVFAAIAEDDISRKIKRGDNSGRTLRHDSVVRELKTIGAAGDSTFSAEIALAFGRDWKKENLKVVVFVQENESRRILGASRLFVVSSKQ